MIRFRDHAYIDANYEKIFQGMESSRSYVKSVREGYSWVVRGGYAFMWDAPVLEYQRKRKCSLTTVGKPFNKKNYAFAVPKKSPYKNEISLAILRLQESGRLEKLRQKWFETESLCPDDESVQDYERDGLKMENMAGVFLVLTLGFVLSLIAALIEHLWFKLKEPRIRFSSFKRTELVVNTSASDPKL
ncbi:glutamate receptor ionotropic, kainate 5-like [Convolutriloba macropyga]|uniref:glutamate receptor ionotropic, kainate 5-like n=1 Tax=Convolutriloba macropyga TaxID=536237 RepID=UPI003F5272C9